MAVKEEQRFLGSSDEDLVLLLQGGGSQSAAAFGELLERMNPVICKRVDSIAGGGCGSSREDLIQEGMLGFLSAISAYRPERGASFRTFASVCVGNRVVSALRRGAGAASTAALSEYDFPQESAAADPQELFFSMEETRRMMEVIRRRLSKLERAVAEATIEGERPARIAQRLGISAKAADNALQRVRRKLQQFRD
ncbi:MAG: sigma-70 family RNA polymerase sigma factor [Oscillospiraceae bacterium]|jgi:RNA polymerase sporulation-specific sigma factor|nr:sigma-70 family RNA polymerase sigma factor [Oscillospiraceae bacterium]